MSRNNDVTRVMVTKGNAACLADGAAIGTLAVGQIGIFDSETNLAIDGSVVPRNFFMAVGLDRDGDAAMDDILQSSGQLIQTRNVKQFTYREHTAAQPMIVDVIDYSGSCETGYAIKLEFRNQELYRTQGFVQSTKTYTIMTDCCDDCSTDCPTDDANNVTIKFLTAFAADTDALVTALPLARSAMTIITHDVNADYAAGDVILESDLDAMIIYNAANAGSEVYSDLQLTTVALAVNNYCNVNLLYFAPRQTFIITSLIDVGFSCNGSTVVAQEMANEEGNGYDVAQKEYHSSGNQNNQPYVLSTANGVALDIVTWADKTDHYDQFYLQYNQDSQAGWLEFMSNLSTTVAVPAADTVTRNSLAAVLDGVLAGLGFDALADDVATANVDVAVVSPTTDKTPATDGIA